MNYFEPSRENGEALRGAMDAALWSSVRDELAIASKLSPSGCSKVPPATALDYGAYSDLVLPLPKGRILTPDIRDDAETHLRSRLSAAEPSGERRAANPPRVTNFDSGCYSPDQLARLDRWWDIEAATPMGLTAVPEIEFGEARGHIGRAFEALERAAPDLFAETIAIVKEIVAANADGSQRYNYAGGSSFALWGAVLVNPQMLANWLRYYRTIVHEAGHLLLFAVGRDEPLVLNDPGETYTSPVRYDPRPMDGIFHAAFVNARESLAYDRLLAWHDETAGLAQDEPDVLTAMLEGSATSFWQCHEVLEREASLSELGRAILRDCEDYMTRNFALVTQ